MQDGNIYNSTALPEITATSEMPGHLRDMQAAADLGIYRAHEEFLSHPITEATVGILSVFITPSFFATKALTSTTATTVKATKGGVQYTKSSLKIGQQMHKAYHAGQAGKEFRLPSGKRIDFLWINNQIIYELKPYNPRGIKQGQKQLQMYLEELQSMPRFQGYQWKTILEFY